MTERIRPPAPRIEPLDPDTLDDETKKYVPPGALNIFRTLANHPKLLKRWGVFGNHVLAKNTLPARERELLILRTGYRCASEYEFGQHTVIGLRDGVTETEIVALTKLLDHHPWEAGDLALLMAADELHDDQCISESTWAALSHHWSTEQMLDIIFTIGQYTLVSMALNSAGVELDEGVPGWPT